MKYISLLFLVPILCLPVVAGPIKVPNDVNKITCTPGESFEISGSYSGDSFIDGCALMERRTVLQQRGSVSLRDHYDFVWTAPGPGIYPLDVVYSYGGRAERPYRTLIVVCSATPPAMFPDLSNVGSTDLDASLESVDPTVTHATIYFAGAIVADSGAPFKATLPVASQDGGSYDTYFTCTDTAGNWYQSPTIAVRVPVRISLHEVQAVLNKPTDTVPLSVTLADGMKPASVSYMMQSDVVATTQTAPYSVNADLSTYATGSYSLTAMATMPNGHTYTSAAQTLELTNYPDDATKAIAAKQAAIAQANIAAAEQAREAAQAKATAENDAAEQAREAAQAKAYDRAHTYSNDGMTFHLTTLKWIGSQIFGNVHNDSGAEIPSAWIFFKEIDVNGSQIGTILDSVTDLAPGATWRFKGWVDDDAVQVKFDKLQSYP